MICVQGYTHYTYITHIYYCDNVSSLRFTPQRPREIHITRQPYWKGVHISLVICVLPTHITSNMRTGVHISRGYIYYCHNASSLRSSLQSPKGIHITRQPYWKGVHISLVICVQGYTYHGGTYTIVTTPVSHITVHISLVICVRGCTYDGDTYTIVTIPVSTT